ncbi:MAG: biotin/lipoyl-binding protein [Clostridia bacterium]|nr:biotin/lipoyl-binding protein [Clostridia bacterium]
MKLRALCSLILACVLLLGGAALADYEFDGTVVCVRPDYVTASIGGTVAGVPVLTGQLVSSGDVLAELATTKVYAAVDGDVTGIFCAPGDSISDITGRYGALLYLEPDSKYSLTASTDYAYNASDNKYIHVGEQVYLLSSDGSYKGTGFVTGVNGTDFTVEASGSFYVSGTVYVYRAEAHTARTRIGRGEIERAASVAVSGSGEGGSVVAVHVSEGDHVQAGDLLLETLNGEYDARYCTGSALKTDADGILAALNVSVGAGVNKGDVIATLYPRDALQLEVDVNEADLSALPIGADVEISFSWNEDTDDAAPVSGKVAQVLYTAVGSGESAPEGSSTSSSAFAAYIDFEADENIRLGMTAVVRPAGSADTDAAPDAEADANEDAPDADAPDADAQDGRAARGDKGGRREGAHIPDAPDADSAD